MNSNFIAHRRHILSPNFSTFSFAYEQPNRVVLSDDKNKWIGDAAGSDLGTRKVSVHVFDALSLGAI